MSGSLDGFLDLHRPVLIDGATGTSLFDSGLPVGEAPELWNESNPEQVRSLVEEFVEAGSDIVLTNSFGGNRYRLALHGREADVHELNRRAAEIACSVAGEAGRTVIVAGSIGPTGEILEPVGSLPFESAVAAFEEQGRGLLDGGADLLWGETLSSREEMLAIAEAARRLGAPYCLTLSFDTAGRTMMGLRPAEFAELAAGLAPPPLAIGANCGTGPSDLLAAVLEFGGKTNGIPVIAKANAGVPEFIDGHIHYSGTPATMARYACLARDAGAQIIGACCGSRGAHITAMREALLATPVGPRPTREAIREATGDFIQIAGGGEKRRGRRGRKS